MTLNWRSIELYDLPPYIDILLRIDTIESPYITYVIGRMDEYGFICTHHGWHIEIGNTIFSKDNSKNEKVKAIYYIDPREILL